MAKEIRFYHVSDVSHEDFKQIVANVGQTHTLALANVPYISTKEYQAIEVDDAMAANITSQIQTEILNALGDLKQPHCDIIDVSK